MKKLNLLFCYIVLTLCYSLNSCGQSASSSDSIEFCGKNFKAPKDCEVIGNMIKCSNYVFTWTYEPVSDLPRHRKELLAQISSPKKINVSVLGRDLIGYLSKVDTYDQLVVVGEINGRGVIVDLYLNKTINSTNDLPEYIMQFIKINP